MASAAEKELSVFIPSLAFCGDNAAMIAAAGYHNLRAGHVCSLTDDVYSKVMTLQHP
jgi:N6-L-threonylcarbamoyladenine synthase